MKLLFCAPLVLVFLVGGVGVPRMAAAAAPADKGKSDLAAPEKRREAVALAQRLTRPPEPASLSTDLPNPFNPAGFDQGDPEEARATLAALNKAGGGGGGAGGGGAAGGAVSPNQPARQPGEREILENLAAKLPTKGTIILNGQPFLILTGGRVKVGDKFTVAFNGQDYELELTAIERTTFTLRYHGEEIVRPIKNGK